MEKRRPKIIWIPCDLKVKVKKLAHLNGITCSDLIRLSIEAKLPDYEAGRPPFKSVEMQGSVSRKPSQVMQNEI
jgi:hypothetical protein